jgi:hypothetical protein
MVPQSFGVQHDPLLEIWRDACAHGHAKDQADRGYKCQFYLNHHREYGAQVDGVHERLQAQLARSVTLHVRFLDASITDELPPPQHIGAIAPLFDHHSHRWVDSWSVWGCDAARRKALL